MAAIRDILEYSSGIYNHIFEEWLYIHFSIRTLILILVMWMLVYACAQVLQYLLVPLSILFIYHVLFRLWNYFFVETPQEWIYIRYFSQEKPFMRGMYARLCDRIKRNRQILGRVRYANILAPGTIQRATTRLMVVMMVLVTLWTAIFGLYGEYTSGRFMSFLPRVEDIGEQAKDEPSPPTGEEQENYALSEDFVMDPATWPADATLIFTLTAYGSGGSNIRDLPSVENGTPLEIVYGGVRLLYLHAYAPDENDADIFWLKVRAPSGVEGYVNETLLMPMPNE
jgi:hypothetical protein